MAIKWLKLKMDYGFRSIPKDPDATNMQIEHFCKDGVTSKVELWNAPDMPITKPKTFGTVRQAKAYANAALSEVTP